MRNLVPGSLHVTNLPVDSLTPHASNARTHSKEQLRQIAASIRTFGFTNPILIDGTKRIIAGHGRAAAAKLLGIDTVPTIQLDSLSEDEIRAFIIADNRIAERAGWDRSILAIELQHLIAAVPDLDLTITGFEAPEIDLIIEEGRVLTDKGDDLPVIDHRTPAVSQAGDLWILGKHRVLCADSLKEASFKSLMRKDRASVVFIDPPYNLRIEGNVSGKGSVHHREFAMASGEMNEAEFVSFLCTSLQLLARYSANASVHFVCIDWRHVWELLSAAKQVYESILNLCVWNKRQCRHGLVLSVSA